MSATLRLEDFVESKQLFPKSLPVLKVGLVIICLVLPFLFLFFVFVCPYQHHDDKTEHSTEAFIAVVRLRLVS